MSEQGYQFLSMVPHYESGWRNIRNYLYNDDPRKGPIRTASGLFQITNTNWNNYAPRLDIRDARDPSKPARTAMDALPADQMRVAYEVWKEQGELAWTAYNRPFAYARQRGVEARSATPEELARFSASFGGGVGREGISATARKSLGLDGAAGGIVPASYRPGGGGGVGGSPFTVDASGNLVDTRGGEMASPVPPAAGGAPSGAPAAAPAPTGPPDWLTNLVGPTVANAIGSAPASTMGQGGTGFLGGLTSMLSNPLAQAALKGYFTAISAPRGTSPFGRVGLGGLGAMQGLTDAQVQEEQFKYRQQLLPIMQQRAQAAADASKAIATYRQGQAQGPQRILAANQATANAWRALAAQTTDPIEQQNLLAAADAADQNASKQLDYNTPFKAGQTIAGTEKTQVQAREVEPARAEELKARRQLDIALAGDVPFKSAKEAADAAVAQAKVTTLLPAQKAAAIANARDKFGKQYDAMQSVWQRLGHAFVGALGRDQYIEQQMKAAGLSGETAPGPGPAPTGPSAPLAPPPGTPSGLPGAPAAAPTPAAPTGGGQMPPPNIDAGKYDWERLPTGKIYSPSRHAYWEPPASPSGPVLD